MTYFLFAGDMLVMFFMAALVVWVFWRSPDSTVRRAGRIPLEDERLAVGAAGGKRPAAGAAGGEEDQPAAGAAGGIENQPAVGAAGDRLAAGAAGGKVKNESSPAREGD